MEERWPVKSKVPGSNPGSPAIKYVALALPIDDLAECGYLPEVCNKYPGSHWLLHFHRLCNEAGISVHSAKTLSEAVRSGQVDARSVALIREEQAETYGLLDAGCKKIRICLESPMYQPHWYDFNQRNSSALSLLNGGIHFPCFEEVVETPKSSDRDGIACMVTANKQWWTHSNQFWSLPWYREAIKNELHGERLKVIEHFGKKDWFKLYGHGWGNLHLLPQYQGVIDVVKKLNPLPVDNKNAILKQYKFTFCYENTALPNYRTEKVIDALVAGSIPIYLGDPYVRRDMLGDMPGSILLDARRFPTLNDLEEEILTLTPHELNAKQEAGRAWLEDQGQVHRFSYFAIQIFNLVADDLN